MPIDISNLEVVEPETKEPLKAMPGFNLDDLEVVDPSSSTDKGVKDESGVVTGIRQFGRGLAKNLPSIAGGTGAALLAGAAFPAAVAASPVLLPIAAGTLGAFGLRTLADIAEPHVVGKERVQEWDTKAQKSPWASTIGDLASLLTVPTPSGVATTARAASKLPRMALGRSGAGLNLTPAELSSLLNAGINEATLLGPQLSSMAGAASAGQLPTRQELGQSALSAVAGLGTTPVYKSMMGRIGKETPKLPKSSVAEPEPPSISQPIKDTIPVVEPPISIISEPPKPKPTIPFVPEKAGTASEGGLPFVPQKTDAPEYGSKPTVHPEGYESALSGEPQSRKLVFTSMTDKIRDMGGIGPYMKSKLDEFFDMGYLFGNTENQKIVPAVNRLGSNAKVNRLNEVLHAEQDAHAEVDKSDFTPEMLQSYKEIKSQLRGVQEDAIARGQKVWRMDEAGNSYLDDPKIDDFYFPGLMSQKVAEDVNMGRPELKEHVKAQVKWLHDQGGLPYVSSTWELAKTILEKRAGQKRLSAIGNYNPEPGEIGEGIRFKARRMQAGVGLAPSLREKSLFRTLERYNRRSAIDKAWHEYVEKDALMRSALGLSDPRTGKPPPLLRTPDGKVIENIAGKKPVEDYLKLVNLEYLRDETFNRIPSLVHSLLIQTPGRIRDNIHSATDVVTQSPDLKSVVQGYYDLIADSAKWLGEMSQGDFRQHPSYRKIFEGGQVRPTPNIRQSLNIAKSQYEILGGGSGEKSERMYDLTRLFNRLTFSNFVENISHILPNLVGRRAIVNSIHKSLKGDAYATDWLRRHGIKSATPTPEQVERGVFQFDQDVAGRYTPEAQPGWILKPGAPNLVLGLAKYGVSRWRGFMDIVQRRDYKMMAKLPLVALVSGGLQSMVWKAMTGKDLVPGASVDEILKQIPDTEDKSILDQMAHIANDPKLADAFVSRIAGLMVLSGAGGLPLEAIFSAYAPRIGGVQGEFINAPTFDYINTHFKNAANAYQAYMAGDVNFSDMAVQYGLESFINASQLFRAVSYQLGSRAPETSRLNRKYRERDQRHDMTVFNQLSGAGNKTSSSGGFNINPYVGLNERLLENQIRGAISSGDFTKARSKAKNVVDQFEAKRTAGKIPYYDVESKFKALHSAPSTAEPSLSNLPKADEYYEFLHRTYGKARADKYLEELSLSELTKRLKKVLVEEALIDGN